MSLLGRILSRTHDSPREPPADNERDVVCLAFSRKHGGRCLAGLSLDDGHWVRPISSTVDGTLTPKHYLLDDRSEPRILDLIRVPLERARPEPHQPENWVAAAKPWRLISRPAGHEAWELISKATETKALTFGYAGDRIAYKRLLEHPVAASLALIAPVDLRLISTEGHAGSPQARLRFWHGGSRYNLVLTDPAWELEIAGRPPGEYAPGELGLDPDRVRLTISLGEPTQYDGNCYKLVAAIFEAPLAGRLV